MTLLIASTFADTVEELDLLSTAAWLAGADAMEARIDRFRDTPSKLNQFLRSHCDRKWLITCRSQSEGGKFIGDGVEAGLCALEGVEGTNAWIDVELTAWRADSELRARLHAHLNTNPTTKLILSAHFLEESPDGPASLVEEALHAGPQVVAKVAYKGDHIADSFPALDLMHRYGSRVVAICMGETGAWSRVPPSKLGAFASFASLYRNMSTAPGQWSVNELRESFGWERIDTGTRVFGVAGDPVAHSLSPQLFNHWFKQHNSNAVFVPLRVGADRGGIAQFLAECRHRPWLHLSGLSVTIPHKIEAMHWAGETADPMSRGIGAANTLVLGEAGPAAYNTDCYAAVDSLANALGRTRNELNGLTVDVLGAGGAARAACYGLAEMGCHISVFARSHKDTQDFVQWGVEVRDWAQCENGSGEVLVNCTPIGMWPHMDESPVPATMLRNRQLVFDLVYRPLKTKLLTEAEAAGCKTLGGLDVFVRQAATQFALWTGISPDTASAYEMLESLLKNEAGRHRCVALIGARGSGKTTVGALLAKILNVAHVDTDELVTAGGQTIAQIFAAEGEEGFRRREAGAICSAIARAPAVISLGGGAVLEPRNVELVRSKARIVWLTAPADELARRVSQDSNSPAQRPKLTSLDARAEMEKVVRAREPLYRAAADFIVDTFQLDAAEVAQRIADWIKQ